MIKISKHNSTQTQVKKTVYDLALIKAPEPSNSYLRDHHKHQRTKYNHPNQDMQHAVGKKKKSVTTSRPIMQQGHIKKSFGVWKEYKFELSWMIKDPPCYSRHLPLLHATLAWTINHIWAYHFHHLLRISQFSDYSNICPSISESQTKHYNQYIQKDHHFSRQKEWNEIQTEECTKNIKPQSAYEFSTTPVASPLVLNIF